MPFALEYACGFEVGSKIDGITYDPARFFGLSSPGHTGSYYLQHSCFGGNLPGRIEVPNSNTEIYLAVWYMLGGGGAQSFANNIGIETSAGQAIYMVFNQSTYNWDAYGSAGKVADGTIQINDATPQWHHYQIHIVISSTGTGVVQTKIDGVLDVNYSGATASSGGHCDFIRLSGGTNVVGATCRIDDLIFGTGDWPGDLRIDPIYPTADTADEDWLLSTGSDSYALIDEVPMSESDYLYTTTDGDQTIVEMSDWDDTDKVPVAVVAWVAGKKDDANDARIAIIDQEAPDTNVDPSPDYLLTQTRYTHKLMLTAPDGTAWDDTHIDNLELGVQANIP